MFELGNHHITTKPSSLQHDGTIVYHKIIDNNNDFNLQCILVDGKSLIYNQNDSDELKLLPFDMIESVITMIIKEFSNKINNFILNVEYTEANLPVRDILLLLKSPRPSLVRELFKIHKLSNRLLFRSNAIPTFNFTDIKYQPISYYLGKNIDSMFDINERTMEYTFLSLYGGYRAEREEVHQFLKTEGILEKSIYSYNSIDSNIENSYSKWIEGNMSDTDKFSLMMKPGEYYRNTFCSIVYESNFNNNVTFFTEKVNKCFLGGHPFIVVSTPKFLSNLKELGFETFNRWWDESYDDEPNDLKRMKTIKETILDVSSWSIEKCREVYTEMIPILQHNQNILRGIRNQYVSDTYYVLPPKSKNVL